MAKKKHPRITPDDGNNVPETPQEAKTSKKKEFNCPHCDFVAKNKGLLASHVKRTHSAPEKKEEEKPEEPKQTEIQKAQQAGIDIKALIGEIRDEVKSELKAEAKADPQSFLASGATQEDINRHKTKKERMKAYLESQPKETIFLPLEGNEKRGEAVLPITLNGYRLNIPKGVRVQVPRDIADYAMESIEATEAALSPVNQDGKPLRLDLVDNETYKALN